MFRNKDIFFAILIIFVSISLFSLAALASEIEIRPVVEGQEYYIMYKGETQSFQASGIGWDKEAQQKIPNVEIKEIQWSFDARFLELVEKKGQSITLKAIKDRTTKLTITGKVNDKQVIKTIFIVIKRKQAQENK